MTPVEGTTTQFLYTGIWNEQTVDILCTIDETGLNFSFERQDLMTTTVGMREVECKNGVIAKDGNTIDLIYKIYLPGAVQWDDSCTSHLVR